MMFQNKLFFLWLVLTCLAASKASTEESAEDVFFAKGGGSNPSPAQQPQDSNNDALVVPNDTDPTTTHTVITSPFVIEYKGMQTPQEPASQDVQAVHDATAVFAQEFWKLQVAGLTTATTAVTEQSNLVNSHGTYHIHYETTLKYSSSSTTVTQAELDHLLTTQWKHKSYYDHVVASLPSNNPFVDCHQMILTSLSRHEEAVRRLSIVVILAIAVVVALPAGIALILAANICSVPIWCCYYVTSKLYPQDEQQRKQDEQKQKERDGFLKDDFVDETNSNTGSGQDLVEDEVAFEGNNNGNSIV